MEPNGSPSGGSTPPLLLSNPSTPRSGNSHVSKGSSVSVRAKVDLLEAKLDSFFALLTTLLPTQPAVPITHTEIINPVTSTSLPTPRTTSVDLATGINIDTDISSAGGSMSSVDARKKLLEPSTSRKDVRFNRSRHSSSAPKDISAEDKVFASAKPGRMSALFDVMEEYKAVESVSPPQVVAVSDSLIDYSPCTLNTISPSSVLWFIDTIKDFQRDHKHQKLMFNKAIPARLRPQLKSLVLVRNEPELSKIIHKDWHSIDNQSIIDILQLAVSPNSLSDYESTMKKGLQFKYHSKQPLTIFNLESFYCVLDEYFLYAADFYELMCLDRCSQWYLPLYRKSFRNENSLIGIIFNWLLSISEIAPYFTKVKERLISENAFRSMENLDDFFTAMKLQLIHDVKLANESILLSKDFVSDDMLSIPKPANEFKDKRSYAPSATYSVRSSQSRGRSVNALDEYDSGDDGNVCVICDDTASPGTPDDDDYDSNTVYGMALHGQPTKSHIGDPISNLPCLTMLNLLADGIPYYCRHGGCKKSHDPGLLAAHANKLLVHGVFFNPQIRKAFLSTHDIEAERAAAVAKQLSTPSGMRSPHPLSKEGVPVSILKRDIRAVSMVNNTVNTSTVAAAFKEFNSELNDKEHSWLAHTSMFARSVLSVDPMSKPFHVTADITVGDYALKAIPTLLDTGATHQNYISSALYNANKAMFASVYHDVQSNVLLADHSTKAAVSGLVCATVTVYGTQVTTTTPCVFGVFDMQGQLGVIIGGNTIVRRLRPLLDSQMCIHASHITDGTELYAAYFPDTVANISSTLVSPTHASKYSSDNYTMQPSLIPEPFKPITAPLAAQFAFSSDGTFVSYPLYNMLSSSAVHTPCPTPGNSNTPSLHCIVYVPTSLTESNVQSNVTSNVSDTNTASINTPTSMHISAALPLLQFDHSTQELEDPFSNSEVIYDEDIVENEGMTYADGTFDATISYLTTPYAIAFEKLSADAAKAISPPMSDACPQLLGLLLDTYLPVFLPRQWTGILNKPPYDVQHLEGLPFPVSHPVSPLPLSVQVQPQARAELMRQIIKAHRPLEIGLPQPAPLTIDTVSDTGDAGYFFVSSDSPVASQWFVVNKGKMLPDGSYPQIRGVAHYAWLRKYISIPQHPLKNVQHTINLISQYRFYTAMDLMNAFHQIPITERTSKLFTVVSHWGAYRPLFLPEGVSSASAILQQWVSEIFEPLGSWILVIFDNILILATDHHDMFDKVIQVLERAMKFKVVLKMSKCEFGVDTVEFFGYYISKGTYRMSDERVTQVTSIPFPTSIKPLQRALGAFLFMKSNIPNYAQLTAPLTDMTKKTFNWKEETWVVDYRAAYAAVLLAIKNQIAITFANYTLTWLIHSDASDVSAGGAIFQVRGEPSKYEYECIALYSHKFSDVATRWDTAKKEACAVYLMITKHAYLLQGKQFILLSDHHNLLHMEKMSHPMVKRWCIELNTRFSFKVGYIPGAKNHVADWLSRVNSLDTTVPASIPSESDILLDIDDPPIPTSIVDTVAASNDLLKESPTPSLENILAEAHADGKVHRSQIATMDRVRELAFPVVVPQSVVFDYVRECPLCQKIRSDLSLALARHPRTTLPAYGQRVLGFDYAPVTPKGRNGHVGFQIMVELHTKFVDAIPVIDESAEQLALCLHIHESMYGPVDEVRSDPSRINSSILIDTYCKLRGVKHVPTIVDNHTGHATEGSVKKVKRALLFIVSQLRDPTMWDSPAIYHLALREINTRVNSETGFPPMTLKFGSLDAAYMSLPRTPLGAIEPTAFLKALDDLKLDISNAARQHMESVAEKRLLSTSKPLSYAAGDLVLLGKDSSKFKASTMTAAFAGPFKVSMEYKNDISITHLATNITTIVDLGRLKPFFGTYEQAFELACMDEAQHVVLCVRAWRGTPGTKSSVELLLQFADGDERWRVIDNDTRDVEAVREYLANTNCLRALRTTVTAYRIICKTARTLPVTLVSPGDTVYVDLRSYGYPWFATLLLPNYDTTSYVVACRYVRFVTNTNTLITLHCDLFDETYNVDNVYVYEWGMCLNIPTGAILLDPSWIARYPLIISDPTRRAHIISQFNQSAVHMITDPTFLSLAQAPSPPIPFAIERSIEYNHESYAAPSAFNILDQRLHAFLFNYIPGDWELVPHDYEDYPWCDTYEPSDLGSLVDIRDYAYDDAMYDFDHGPYGGDCDDYYSSDSDDWFFNAFGLTFDEYDECN